MSVATRTKCAKPKGEFCRLHNPAPKFKNLDEVFSKVEKETLNHRTAFHQPQPAVNIFQSIAEERTYRDGCPSELSEHIQQSKEQLAHLSSIQKLALTGYVGFASSVCNTMLLGQSHEYDKYAPFWRRSDGPSNFFDRGDLVDYMETMDEILQNRQKDQQVLYRGIPIYKSLHDEIGETIGKDLHINDTAGLVAGLKQHYKPGKVFNFNNYLSTTKSADYAAIRSRTTIGTKVFNFDEDPEIKGIVFELRTNAGLDVTGSVRQHYEFERETILPRDTHFKVVAVHVRPAVYSAPNSEKYSDIPLGERVEHTNIAAVVQMVEVDSKGNEILHTNPHKPSRSVEQIVPR
jgi:hypothetical protein